MIGINIESIIKIYNNCFETILFLIIFYLICMAINLHSKMKEGKDEKWYNFMYVVKKKLMEMIVFAMFVLVFCIFINESFSINIVRNSYVCQYWKIIFSIWIIKNILSGKKLYDKFSFSDFIQKVKRGEYRHASPENIMLDIIDRYNFNYTLQSERLGILKSLTPISLIPLIAGYILEGKDIAVDWNWYTVAFFGILFLYFYQLWRCYKNMQFWKVRALEVQKELRDVQCQSIRSQGDDNEFQNQ